MLGTKRLPRRTQGGRNRRVEVREDNGPHGKPLAGNKGRGGPDAGMVRLGVPDDKEVRHQKLKQNNQSGQTAGD